MGERERESVFGGTAWHTTPTNIKWQSIRMGRSLKKVNRVARHSIVKSHTFMIRCCNRQTDRHTQTHTRIKERKDLTRSSLYSAPNVRLCRFVSYMTHGLCIGETLIHLMVYSFCVCVCVFVNIYIPHKMTRWGDSRAWSFSCTSTLRDSEKYKS